MSKLLGAEKFIMFVRRSYKASLTFRYRFQTLVLALYPYSSANLLKISIKSAKSISESWANSSKAF